MPNGTCIYYLLLIAAHYFALYLQFFEQTKVSPLWTMDDSICELLGRLIVYSFWNHLIFFPEAYFEPS